MYEVDARDRVVRLTELPQSSSGAPCPFVVGDEDATVLAYYLKNPPENCDGNRARVIGPSSADESIALVRFEGCYATMFGPPNDEAIAGHPLAERGLEPYSVFRVEGSSWIRQLARRNSVHPRHTDSSFDRYRHLIFTFHDSTFEVVCSSLRFTWMRGSIQDVVPKMIEVLRSGAIDPGSGPMST